MPFIKNISAKKEISDKELVDAFKQTGDIQQLSTLYQRYMDLVFGVSLKYFKNAEQAKDTVMEIFNELNTKLKLHQVDNFKGWLHILTKNYCLMQLRSPKNLKTVEFAPAFMQSSQNMHLENEAFEKEENLKKLQHCIALLPDEQQQAIKLFYLQSKCYNEIVQITGFDWNRVRSYIQNGKRNLKICMEEKQLNPDMEHKK